MTKSTPAETRAYLHASKMADDSVYGGREPPYWPMSTPMTAGTTTGKRTDGGWARSCSRAQYGWLAGGRFRRTYSAIAIPSRARPTLHSNPLRQLREAGRCATGPRLREARGGHLVRVWGRHSCL